MPTLRAGTSTKTDGFTLLELAVVLFIIALISAIAIPRLQPFLQHGDTNKAVRQIRGLVRYVAGASLSTRMQYRISYDFSERTCHVTRQNSEGDYVEERDAMGRRITLPPGVIFKDVMTPRGTQKEGTAYTDFYPNGWIEYTMIHVQGFDELSVKLVPLTGEVKVYEGYVVEDET